MKKRTILTALTSLLVLSMCVGCGSETSTSSILDVSSNTSLSESSVVSEVSIESSKTEFSKEENSKPEIKITSIKLNDSKNTKIKIDEGSYKYNFILVQGSECDDYGNEIEFVTTNSKVATIKLDKGKGNEVWYRIDGLSAGTAAVYAQTKDGKLKTDKIIVNVISKKEASRLAEESRFAEESKKAEELRLAEQSQAQEENLKKNAIRLSNVYTSEPNSAGGVDLYATFTNVSGKAIKYIYFTATAYNAVNDPAYCEIRDTAYMRCKCTGPLNSGCSTDDTYWDCLWYNSTIKYAKITNVSVEFMDGTTIEIPDKYL